MLSKEQADAAADAILAQHHGRHERAKSPDLTGMGVGAVIGGTAGLVAAAVSGTNYPAVAFAIAGSGIGYLIVLLARRLARAKAVTRD